MKTIHLIRHAKSSWDDPALADIDRPLNKRGRRSCQVMGRAIREAGCDFSRVFVSPACRAQSTISLLNDSISDREIEWQTDAQLYTFDSRKLFSWFECLNDELNEVVVVGHNPALTELCNRLAGCDIENIPTCAYAQLISEDLQHWCDIRANTFRLMQFIRPKPLLKKAPK